MRPRDAEAYRDEEREAAFARWYGFERPGTVAEDLPPPSRGAQVGQAILAERGEVCCLQCKLREGRKRRRGRKLRTLRTFRRGAV